MDFKHILYEKRNGVATITLNNPGMFNALTDAMGDELGQALKDAEGDLAILSLILTGADPGFCSGLDMRRVASRLDAEATGAETRSRVLLGRGVFGGFSPTSLYHSRLVTIAAVNGPAVDPGFAFALFCDIRIASEKARFSTRYIRRGVPPHVGETYLLTRLVGTARAFELMLLGDFIDAHQAEKYGIVSKVVPHDQLMPEARALAERFAKGPAIAISLGKKLITRAADIAPSAEDQMVLESFYTNMCHNTEDYKEGVRASIEKREPVFKGR
ncbi:MAG: enoyl-CoA hydratase/isomerase family protein [Chloroflexi bacterium]|nr:enoyl-CoA hydratase/isomerase family protein [Chloroflexota bacterium]